MKNQNKNQKKNTSTPISELIGKIPKPKILGESFVCECGHEVSMLESIIVGGPNKGKPMVYKYNCKCTEKKFAEEAWDIYIQLKQKRVMELFELQSFLPPILKNATFENFKPQNENQIEIFQTMVEFARDFKAFENRNILLTGDHGIGKSHLCVSAIKLLMQKGYTAIFCDMPQMFTKIKSTFKNDSDISEAQILSAFKNVDILVLDDMGAEAMTDWRKETLLQIINSRAGLHTLYTTNMNKKGMLNHIEDRNYSKLMQNTEVLRMEGKCMRVK